MYITAAGTFNFSVACESACIQAAAAMNVDVGYFSDPAELPGLAHFLGEARAPPPSYPDCNIISCPDFHSSTAQA